ncbi:MAG: hypothetical protein ACRDRJ_10100 [Streptosporangiaceae bacterium]
MTTRTTPTTYLIFRAVASAIMLTALLVVGLGFARMGPLSSLGGLTHHATTWLHINTGVDIR